MLRHPSRGARADATRVIAGLSLLVVLLLGASIAPWQRPAVITAAPAPVRVAQVTVGDLKAAVSLSGELRPTDQTEIAPRVSSRIVRLPATIGRQVRAGEVLAELDRTQLDVAVIQAQAALAKDKAALAKLQTSTRAEDLAREEASVRAAEAALATVLAGPKAEDVESARQKLNQARETRARTASTLANSREQARLAVEQAAASLQQAQMLYGAAKLIWDEADRTDKDPNIASCPDDNKRCNNLTDTKRRSYKADFESKEIAMRSAETALAAREIAYADSQRQEATGLQIASSQVADAQLAFDKARSGPEPGDVAEAEAELQDARSSLITLQNPETLEPELAAARAAVQSAEASLRLAEANQREAAVVAPFAGIVTQKYVSVGSNVTSSTAIVQLVSTTLEARLSADDSQVVLLEPGQPADLRLTAYPGVVFPARVDGISPAANPTSRTFTATIIPETQDARLKPGMLVQGDIAAINRPAVLMTPEQAVVTRGLESYVFTVADGKARRKPVTLGVRGGGMVEVLSGLSAGETVVIDGQAALNDNDQVTVTG